MTGHERSTLEKMDARLFGLDGSGVGENGGAIGNIVARIERVERRMAYWAGGIAVLVFIATIAADVAKPLIAQALGLPK